MADDSEFIRWLQQRLTAHGFTPGPVDGIAGKLTLAALRAFERANGLPVNGTADPAVVRALRAPARPATPREMFDIPDRDEEVDIQVRRQLFPRQRDVPSFYGARGSSLVRVSLPYDMYLAWDKSHRLRSITLHKKVAESADRCFQRIASRFSSKERSDLGIDLFGGSYNERRMRGGNSWSMHSWAIAIDFDPERNQLSWKKPKARLSHDDAIPFWEIWEDEGWLSLGRARNYDWMHVQAALL